MARLGFKRKDYLFISGAILLGVFGGIIGHLQRWPVTIENYTSILTSAAIALGLHSLFRNIQGKKGSYARNLEILGIGSASFLVSWMPHIVWHMADNPAWLNLKIGFWTGFFHTWNTISFLIIAYGMYLFYKSTGSEMKTSFSEDGFMNLHLIGRDYQFLMFTGWTVLLGGIVGQMVGFTSMFEWLTTVAQMPFIIAALYFILKNQVWEGEIGRALNLIGVGLIMIMVDYIPHIPWHIAGNPGMGFSTGFWVGLFHMWITGGFLMIAYGFHEV